MTDNIRNTIFTEEELTKLNIIREYIENNKENIHEKRDDAMFPIFYLDENNEIKVNNSYNYNGLGVEYRNSVSLDYSYIKTEGYFKNGKLDGTKCIQYYEDGKTPKYVGTFENDTLKQGKYYKQNGTIYVIGNFENDKLNGKLDGTNCIQYYEDGKTPKYVGTFENGEFIKGKWYNKNGTLYSIGNFKNDKLNGKCEWYDCDGKKVQEGDFEYNKLHGQNCKYYRPITIQQGEFKNDWLYSGSGYLRKDPKYTTIEEHNNEQIKEENKIYTLERDINNPNKKRLIFYTTHPQIRLDRNIVINIDENNIATLQTIDGEPLLLTETETEKIQQFFTDMSLEQIQYFDERLSPLFYTPIINKIKYPNITVLLPDVHEYHYKENKDITQTTDILNKIPQDKRKGKYIIPCMWLKSGHQVNLMVDFDKKICEIINTAVNTYAIDKNTMLNLEKALNIEFNNKNWCVYENNIVQQSTGNCYIASNMVATEKVMLEERGEKYNKKYVELEKVEEQIKNIEEQQNSVQNTKNIFDNKAKIQQLEERKINLQDDTDELLQIINSNNVTEEEVQSFLTQYNDKIETIVINEILYNDLRNEVNELKKERQGQINEEELLKEVLKRQSIKDRINKIKEDKERLQLKKDNFATYNLILKERLFNECDKQFDREWSNSIINGGKAIRNVDQL